MKYTILICLFVCGVGVAGDPCLSPRSKLLFYGSSDDVAICQSDINSESTECSARSSLLKASPVADEPALRVNDNGAPQSLYQMYSGALLVDDEHVIDRKAMLAYCERMADTFIYKMLDRSASPATKALCALYLKQVRRDQALLNKSNMFCDVLASDLDEVADEAVREHLRAVFLWQRQQWNHIQKG